MPDATWKKIPFSVSCSHYPQMYQLRLCTHTHTALSEFSKKWLLLICPDAHIFFYRWTTYTLISSVRVLRCDPCDYSLGSQLLIVRRKPLMNILMKKAFFCQGFPDRSREPIKNLSNTTCLHWWKLKTIQYFCWSESVLHICQVCQSIYNNNTVT